MATEKRLIDANALYQTMESNLYWGLDSDGAILDTIDEAPTVDAVEVVRCKDCKHWVRIDAHSGDCKNRRFALVGISAPQMYDCDFCVLGERKDND